MTDINDEKIDNLISELLKIYYSVSFEYNHTIRDSMVDVLNFLNEKYPRFKNLINGEAVIVDIEPSPGLLTSMAIRYDHGLGIPDYYNQPLNRPDYVDKYEDWHSRKLDSTIRTMRQLHEEVVGTGFYKPHKEDYYKKIKTPP